MAEWTGFLAAQAFNAGAAAVAHLPSWLIRIPRDTVWFRRLLLLECVMPVPGAVASMVCILAACNLLVVQPALSSFPSSLSCVATMGYFGLQHEEFK